MTYQEATDWLFKQIPNYQNQGGDAYKPGLHRISGFLDFIGNPHNNLKIIHVAGTNGKGSVCHIIAAALQANGYKTGIFTSPHIFDFTERVKIDGQFISKEFVTQFIQTYQAQFLAQGLSFFEITAALSFDYFNEQKVDFAIIETGLGGRLDATNIVSPIVSVITKIGIDHTQFLGDTIEKIAGEKAGIIKENMPVVLGDKNPVVIEVVAAKAKETHSELYQIHETNQYAISLNGDYQKENARIAERTLEVIELLGHSFDAEKTQIGLMKIEELTKFFGRFNVLQSKPLVIVDVAHNKDGVTELKKELETLEFDNCHFIFGSSNDKDVSGIFEIFSEINAKFYLTQFSNARSSTKQQLNELGEEYALDYSVFSSPDMAYDSALLNMKMTDCVVVCGSFFLLADLEFLKERFFQ